MVDALMIGTAVFCSWQAATIWEQRVNARAVWRMCEQQYQMPWQAPGPAPVPQRVDPRTANIIRHWGAEEEQDGTDYQG
jgi:hypothetical protein